jgi:hypothetical protein
MFILPVSSSDLDASPNHLYHVPAHRTTRPVQYNALNQGSEDFALPRAAL